MTRACCRQACLFLIRFLLNTDGPLIVTALREAHKLQDIAASDLRTERIHDGEGEAGHSNSTAERDRRATNCCCKEEACRTRRNHDQPLFEYHLNGNEMCCRMRGSGFLTSCPWFGFSTLAADILPYVENPCSCQWQVWSEGGPKFSDVRQQDLGSCYLLASLASLAHVHPQVIENMFLDNV